MRACNFVYTRNLEQNFFSGNNLKRIKFIHENIIIRIYK